MLSLLRRITHSKIGMIITFVTLIVIALAFGLGGMSLPGAGGSTAPTGTTVATVGKTTISADDLKTEMQSDLSSYRQQNPELTMAQYVEGGGFDATVTRMINSLALQKFGEKQGMIVSKKSIDGQIASAPVFQDPNGKFDPALYKQWLDQERTTDAGLHEQLAQGTFGQMLTSPTVIANQVPERLAMPYASLLLEKRTGMIGFVPTKVMPAGPAPTDKEIADFYQQHIAAYTLPERRVIRYAEVTPDSVKVQATPTDAEIAQAYQAQQARFQPTEKRTLKQVIAASQAAADTLAKKVQSGSSIDDAAKAAGLEASTVDQVSRADYPKQSSPDVANAVFAAKSGAVIGPIKAPLGWSVIRVEKVTEVPGQTLAQAHDTLAKELTAQKTNDVLGKVHDAIDDAVTSGSTFEEIVGDQKLTAQQTPPVTVAGIDPDNPTAKPDPDLSQVIASGFDAQQGDNPELVPVGQAGAFAIVALGKIVPSAPQPLAKVHDIVARDFAIDRADKAAHQVASDIVDKVNKGTAISQAFAAAKLPLPAVQPVHATRAQLSANPQGAPPPLALMFATPAHQAKLLEAPRGAGWLVIYVDTIDRGDASGQPDVVKATRSDLGQYVGREYAEEFASAVSQSVGVKKNDAAIADVRQQLSGGGADAQP
jgi:peptidyl-prolyl cis-trans isomerase D